MLLKNIQSDFPMTKGFIQFVFAQVYIICVENPVENVENPVENVEKSLTHAPLIIIQAR
jgi:hypothetical protein